MLVFENVRFIFALNVTKTLEHGGKQKSAQLSRLTYPFFFKCLAEVKTVQALLSIHMHWFLAFPLVFKS